MFEISKEFTFSASHQLNGLPEDHPCGRLHGHNYRVVLVLGCEDNQLDEVGFVLDYGDLRPFQVVIDEVFDHRHLNEVMGELNPTAENIARCLCIHAAIKFGDLVREVRVSETPKTWAVYRPTRGGDDE